MREEVNSAVFGARVFYVVFYILGITIIYKYKTPISVQFFDGDYTNTIMYFTLASITSYLFFICGKNPGNNRNFKENNIV
jgi:hypothetical protein